MSSLTLAAVYGTVTTITLALSRTIPDVFGSFVVRRALVTTATVSCVAMMGSLVVSAVHFDDAGVKRHVEQFIFWTWLALFTFHFGLGVLLRLYVRATRFKDYGTFLNLRAVPPISVIRTSWRRKKGDRETYETAHLPVEALEKRSQYLSEGLGQNAVERPVLLLTSANPAKLRKYALGIAADLMDSEFDHDANFVCCTTSPEEIWLLLRDIASGSNLDNLKGRFVIIDAYTKVFGFQDEVLNERIRGLNVDEKVHVVENATSAASIHSSTAKAFHILKSTASESRRGKRRPCVMIYDTLSILANSETENELAQFVVHLTAAEIAYDMLTLLLEPDVSNRSGPVLDAIRACCGAPIDIDNNDVK